MWRRKSLEFMFGLYKVIKQIWGLELIYPENQLGALENYGMGLNLGEAGTSPGGECGSFVRSLFETASPSLGCV